MSRNTRWASMVAAAVSVVACGASGQPAASAPAPTVDAGADAAPPPDAAASRPFAATSMEATTLIGQAIDARQADLAQCVLASRARRKEPHAKVALDIGIDQEGTLLGVKLPKGSTNDDELLACVTGVLRTVVFPRSHSGVVTVKKTFEDMTVNR